MNITDSNYKLVITKGNYYFPAHTHYGFKTSVNCDRCKKQNLLASIGHGKYDLCLTCVDTLVSNPTSTVPIIVFPKEQVLPKPPFTPPFAPSFVPPSAPPMDHPFVLPPLFDPTKPFNPAINPVPHYTAPIVAEPAVKNVDPFTPPF
jgi:hypothetical protein